MAAWQIQILCPCSGNLLQRDIAPHMLHIPPGPRHHQFCRGNRHYGKSCIPDWPWQDRMSSRGPGIRQFQFHQMATDKPHTLLSETAGEPVYEKGRQEKGAEAPRM